MDDDILEVRITDDRSQDPERLNRAALTLRKELLGLESVRTAEQATNPSPKGAKSGVVVEIGTLLVSLRFSAPALRELRGFFSDWLRRNDGKKITIKIKGQSVDITGMSEKEIEHLVNSDLDADGAGQ